MQIDIATVGRHWHSIFYQRNENATLELEIQRIISATSLLVVDFQTIIMDR